ncbi:unnamed protein product [Diamesa hyperborea]
MDFRNHSSYYIPRPSLNSNSTTSKTCVDETNTPKRGSRSSQGSSDSEQSTHSASSLLLTVTNLEHFAKIQENQVRSTPHHSQLHHNHHDIIARTHNPNIINIHPSNLLSPYNTKPSQTLATKTKDLDQLSMASSTHFTVVNGFGRSTINRKSNSICRRGQQVSILITTMSILFMAGLVAAVYILEMRSREMPR